MLTVLALAASLAACVTVDDEPRDAKPIPQRLLSQMKSKGMSPADPIMIRIYKQESELELWKRDRTGKFALLKTYPICRWSGKLGPKRVEGDRQAPEGFYAVSAGMLNPRSKFHLSFDLGFPNRLEKALGYEGSSLMVHGACTSSGCYAVTDDGVAEIYAVAREALAAGQPSVQVQALPFRMTPENLALHDGDLNMSFWKNLKEGTDRFDATRTPPSVAYCGRRYLFGDETLDGRMLDPLGACPEGTEALVAGAEPSGPENGSTQPALSYSDGGMHAQFRAILRKAGPERLSKITSESAEVSRPHAALADPYVK